MGYDQDVDPGWGEIGNVPGSNIPEIVRRPVHIGARTQERFETIRAAVEGDSPQEYKEMQDYIKKRAIQGIPAWEAMKEWESKNKTRG